MNLETVTGLAIARRALRWKKEEAQKAQDAAGNDLVVAIAKWKGCSVDRVKVSNFTCSPAPADLHCVFIIGTNPFRNPCVFCGNPEDDFF